MPWRVRRAASAIACASAGEAAPCAFAPETAAFARCALQLSGRVPTTAHALQPTVVHLDDMIFSLEAGLRAAGQRRRIAGSEAGAERQTELDERGSRLREPRLAGAGKLEYSHPDSGKSSNDGIKTQNTNTAMATSATLCFFAPRTNDTHARRRN